MSKKWMCLIIAVLIIATGCEKSEKEPEPVSFEETTETESNQMDSQVSLNEPLSKNEEKDEEEEDFEYTDEYFVEKYSIYRNPIDKYFFFKIYSWDISQVEMRKNQDAYKKAWKTEYKNVMKWLKKKCVYAEDKKNIRLLEKSIAYQIKVEKKVLETEWTNAYKVNLDSSKIKNSISRISLLGHGTQNRLNQSEGEIYRDVCMRILNLCGEDYEFKFCASDEMK